MNASPRPCTAHSKRSGLPCKRWATPGWNVCRFHGAGGGRPIIHGRYSKRMAPLRRFIERALEDDVAELLRLGGRPWWRELNVLTAALAPPTRCTARSKQAKRRCKRPPKPGWTVCHFHGAGGGRPTSRPRPFGALSTVRERIKKRSLDLRVDRIVRLAIGLSVDPPASDGELALASVIAHRADPTELSTSEPAQ